MVGKVCPQEDTFSFTMDILAHIIVVSSSTSPADELVIVMN